MNTLRFNFDLFQNKKFKVQTHDGKEVMNLRKVRSKGKLRYPLIGVFINDEGEWEGASWSIHGEFVIGKQSVLDLFLIPK